MAKARAKATKESLAIEPIRVLVMDSQKRKIAKNLDYRLMATHLGTISKAQVPCGPQRAIYNRLWPLISPQSFKSYVKPGYMAVPDIDRSIEDWDDNCRFSDKKGNQWPRLYVVETFAYDCQDKDEAPEDRETLDEPVVPWVRDEELFLFFELDEHNKPYLKPILREMDANYDAQESELTEAEKPGLRSEYRRETLADMLGGVGFVAEGEKAVSIQVIEKEYQILIPGRAVEAYNAIILKAQKSKKKLTGTELREKAMEVLAKYSVLCYPTFCALVKDNAVTIAMFRRMAQKYGYHRTGTVGKTAIFRPWLEMYPEGVPAHVLAQDAGDVPA